MGEQDVENTDHVTDDSEAQPGTAGDEATQDDQQESSSEEQVTEVTDPVTHEASEESDGPGEGESTEEAEPDEGSEDGDSGTSGDTLLLPGGDNSGTITSGPPNTDDSDESGDFTLSPGGDNSAEITVGDGAGTDEDEDGNEPEASADDEAEPVESVEEPEQEPVAVDAGPEDDATPVEVDNGPPPEDSIAVYPEPTPPSDDGTDDDTEGGKSGPEYEVQVDPHIAAIQAQIDLSHLLMDDDDDEEEELQGIFADPEVERPIVDEQPAPGAGPIPPQPGQAAELDVFDLKVAGDADASPPALVTPDLKPAGDADGTDPELSDPKLGGDADGTDPETSRLARDATLRFDLDGDIKDTGETTTKFEFEDSDASVDRGVTLEPDPVTTAHDITRTSMYEGSLFSVADDDEKEDEQEDDSSEDF